MQLKEYISEIIKRSKNYDDEQNLELDSMEVIHVITDLECELDFEFADEDLMFENFTDIDTIEKLVIKYKEGAFQYDE